MGRVKRIWYLSAMRAANVQASLRVRAGSPEPLLLAHTSSESRGTFRQKAIHDGMLEDTNLLGAQQILIFKTTQNEHIGPKGPENVESSVARQANSCLRAFRHDKF